MKAQEVIRCRGHPLVTGSHPTTFEITCEDHLTTGGNCILGIAAERGCAGLSEEFRSVLAHDEAVLVTRLSVDGINVVVRSKGSCRMTLDNPADMVWRRSSFVCGRTIGITSNHVAATLPRELIGALKKGNEMTVTLTATRPG